MLNFIINLFKPKKTDEENEIDQIFEKVKKEGYSRRVNDKFHRNSQMEKCCYPKPKLVKGGKK